MKRPRLEKLKPGAVREMIAKAIEIDGRVKTLPARQQQVMAYRLTHPGCKHYEASEELGISLANQKQCWKNIQERLALREANGLPPAPDDSKPLPPPPPAAAPDDDDSDDQEPRVPIALSTGVPLGVGTEHDLERLLLDRAYRVASSISGTDIKQMEARHKAATVKALMDVRERILARPEARRSQRARVKLIESLPGLIQAALRVGVELPTDSMLIDITPRALE